MEYILLVVIVGPIVWALYEGSKMDNREIHHDSRKGSFYEISNRRDD